MTGGCLAARSECPLSDPSCHGANDLFLPLPPGGPRSAFGSAVACGVLLGVFEGVGVLLNRAMSEVNRPVLPPSEH